uniref:Uncharacterized protein n=1 Tax=Candidatus Kentrum sp. LPFa TaxID=2126335 RepID=A0A450XQ82_9GAMM|nr:MAG: hypothetical protein BECKLPF1236A_GA0070988_101334 [Candidatus Kentron sp. LPFa]VFK31510.1 MAG: hypothetical protein BECKLPF1236C_GA0070990_101414 [Candidatus Kentron sp. LPFa]
MSNGEIAEIRRIRHQMSAEFGHDVYRLAAYLREVEEELRKSGRFRFEESDSHGISKPNLPPNDQEPQ